MVGTGAIDLYWIGNGGVWYCRSLLGDDAEENDTVYPYWGRSGRVLRCISLLETVR